MRQTSRWLLWRGPAMILIISSVLSIQNLKTYWVTEELWSEREKSFDQLRTQELGRLLVERTDAETRLEQSRLTRQAVNEALLEKLEESLLRFEQSERHEELSREPKGARDLDGT